MKTLTAIAAALLFMGAGCGGTSVGTSEVEFTYPDQEEDQGEGQEGLEGEEGDEEESIIDEIMPVTWEFPDVLSDEEITHKQIRIQTEKGDIVFELFADTAPKTVSNFVYLTSGGYYNGLTFHRREEGFVIQGGDPSGNGTGGPGYKFEDELEDEYSYERGIVAMANAGPNTNGSQFFVMLADVPLPKAYTIFGRVTEGLEVVDVIAIGDTMTSVSVEANE
jgi:peptidyl-prolyl cis-trans isomerase B (cyclophilin B)